MDTVFIAFIIILIIVLIGLYVRYKRKVVLRVGEPILGKIYVAYKFYEGSVAESSQHCADMHEFIRKYNEQKYNETRSIGIFYDDPELTPVGKQRYANAVIIGDKNKPIDTEVENLCHQFGYKSLWLPEVEQAVITNKLSDRFKLWNRDRVFTAIRKYLKTNKPNAHPVIEYWSAFTTIQYMIPLSHQSKFYVDECREKQSNFNQYKID